MPGKIIFINKPFALKKRHLFLIMLLAASWTMQSCKAPKAGTLAPAAFPANNFPLSEETDSSDFRIMSYNVENLFDTYDDTLIDDEQFLPWGMNKWTKERYDLKLKRLFKVISNAGGWNFPDVLCLTEIENRRVLEDLIDQTPLSEGGYDIIHFNSPDARGVDVAMLYRKSTFRPLHEEKMPVRFPFDTLGRTRDVLYVEGLVDNDDTLHIFVCHFPSRRGGETSSEPRRMYVAGMVRTKIDSIQTANPGASIIITGDFNDEPFNRSMSEILRGKSSPEEMKSPGDFYNMMYPLKNKGLGTYKFQGSWNMLDQYLISVPLLNPENKVYTLPASAHIFSPEWLSETDDQGPGVKPLHTYLGPRYVGGYSDHFPIYLDLFFRD